MLRRLHLPARLGVLVLAGAILVALGVALLLTNTIQLHDSSEATTRSETYRDAVSDVEQLVLDAETGLRGYVLTGRPLFMAPTRTAEQRMPAASAALLRAARADGEFVPAAVRLARSARSYVADYVPQLVALARRDRARARSFAVTLQGKRRVDDIRAQASALDGRVSAREGVRLSSDRRSASHATAEAIVVLVLLTVLTLVLGTFLVRLVLARERARDESERTTQILRRSLLPSSLPSVPGCEIAVRFLPARAAELVGGDFYDVFRVGERQWAVVVGDVCGKGADAAAVTAMARWTLRSLAASPAAPADALRFLNGSMLGLGLGGRFITIAYMLLTLEDGAVDVSLACAGHPPPVLVPGSGEPAPLPARGTLLGIWPEIHLETAEARLGPGDGVVLYTDGVSDPGPGPYRPAAEALGARPQDATADQLAGALEAYAREPAGPQRDDIAIVAVRFLDPGRGRAPGSGGSGPRELVLSST